MRRSICLALVALSLAVSPSVAVGQQRPSLQVTIDKSKVDLVAHKLEVKLSRPADKVRIKVVGESGAVLAEVEKQFRGAAPGTALEMTWTPSTGETVMKVEVWGHDTEGYYAGVAIVPWKMVVPHQEVNFQTDSDAIRPPEVPKLEASLKTISDLAAKHADLGKVTLYVLGHTDTVGSTEHNVVLSRKRARAIAAWFKSRGIRIAVAFEGVGESAPLVKTADEVDEPRNRRVDYILGLDPPPLSGDFSWKAP